MVGRDGAGGFAGPDRLAQLGHLRRRQVALTRRLLVLLDGTAWVLADAVAAAGRPSHELRQHGKRSIGLKWRRLQPVVPALDVARHDVLQATRAESGQDQPAYELFVLLGR